MNPKPWNEVDKNVVKILEDYAKDLFEKSEMCKRMALRIRSKYQLTEKEQVVQTGRY